MPVLAGLDNEEKEILIHLLKSKNKEINQSSQNTNYLIDSACSEQEKRRLAKISEEQRFALKNRFLFDKQVMNFADKKRMPLDKIKVQDMLRNKHHISNKVH